MKIILLTGATFSIPVIHYLAGQKVLHSIISPGTPNKNNIPVELNAQHLNIPFRRFLKNEMLTTLKDQLTDAQPDVVFVFGCGYKIPSELFAIPKFGFFNIHFSLLPAYRGNSPMFWQIKNGESTAGVTIHQMTDTYDSGGMLAQQELPILQGENCGLFTTRLSMESVGLIAKGIEKLRSTGMSLLLPQNEAGASYYRRPGPDDLKIDWQTQSATEIESLVNASNPDYGGAIASFRGQPFKILEINHVEMNNPTPSAAGTIVHADINYGVIVACKDNRFVRINIAHINEGMFSGFKLASLGIKAGECFESAANLFGMTIE